LKRKRKDGNANASRVLVQARTIVRPPLLPADISKHSIALSHDYSLLDCGSLEERRRGQETDATLPLLGFRHHPTEALEWHVVVQGHYANQLQGVHTRDKEPYPTSQRDLGAAVDQFLLGQCFVGLA
jgi:hypothetical protein